jgi:hypothetical protein
MLDWNAFSKMNTDAWLEKANQDSKGKYVAEDFVYNVEDDFLVSPFTEYSADNYSENLFNTRTKSGICIPQTDTKSANAAAIRYLESGVESLIFYVDVDTDYADLFKDIFLEYISIVLLTKDDVNVCRQHLKVYVDQYISGSSWDIILVKDDQRVLKDSLSFKSRLELLTHWLKEKSTHDPVVVFVEPKADFIAQIAELRAMRILGHKNNLSPNELRIIATTGLQQENGEIHPLIIENYKLMSAYLGMSDIVAITPGDDQEMTRLMLNMTYIFKEESKLTAVLDPVAGSYIIENLTAQMIGSTKS